MGKMRFVLILLALCIPLSATAARSKNPSRPKMEIVKCRIAWGRRQHTPWMSEEQAQTIYQSLWISSRDACPYRKEYRTVAVRISAAEAPNPKRQ